VKPYRESGIAEPSQYALAAHRDTFFRPLRDIRVGDKITFKTQEQGFSYVVESTEAATEPAIQDAIFSFRDFAVWVLKIWDGRMAHHAETTTLSMLTRQVNT
jgi:hypothetical protein